MANSGIILLPMALALGIRHGFDLDHLSVIDSMTRTLPSNYYYSKIIGVLFSLGHGVVVIIASLIIGSGLLAAQFPLWLDSVGGFISIFFLIIFGIATFCSVLKRSKHKIVKTSLSRLIADYILKKHNNPFIVMVVGALFAISFDTFSQIALFSLAASEFAGVLFAGMLGIAFTFGMMLTDGLNGWIASTIIQRADLFSLNISRLLGLLISFFSLSVAFTNLFKMYYG